MVNPTIPQAVTKGKEALDKQKEIVWNTQAMPMEIPHSIVSLEEEPMEDSNYTQFMEEETEVIHIGDLDLPGLENACTTNNLDNIPTGQLKNLEEVLSRRRGKNHWEYRLEAHGMVDSLPKISKRGEGKLFYKEQSK